MEKFVQSLTTQAAGLRQQQQSGGAAAVPRTATPEQNERGKGYTELAEEMQKFFAAVALER